MAPGDRRRSDRYVVKTPLGARVGAINAVVLDACDKGIGISHEGNLPNPGHTCRVIMNSTLGSITVDCQVMHTRREAEPPAAAKGGFISGLRVIATDYQSEQRFRQLLRSLMGQRVAG